MYVCERDSKHQQIKQHIAAANMINYRRRLSVMPRPEPSKTRCGQSHFIEWIDIRNNHIILAMTEMTEQQLMEALRELIVEGKVRSFVKKGGDPGNPDHWMYEAIEQDNG